MSLDLHEDESPLICLPAKLSGAVAGSVTLLGRCGHQVWISPSGAELMADPDAKIAPVCIDCAPELDLPADAELRTVPGSMVEVEGEVGAERREQLESWLRTIGVQTRG